MDVEIVTQAAQFLFWDYLFQIYDIVSLLCGSVSWKSSTNENSYMYDYFC